MPAIGSKEALYSALDGMVARLAADEAFTARIARTSASIGFVVSDLEGEYGLFLDKGDVRGTAGTTQDTRFQAVMSSKTLDELLKGEVDGESAYWAGRISLRGDDWYAETVAGLIRHMVEAYKAAVAGSDKGAPV